ncbi:hypothetical protein E3N88_06815 [Mikania micrantha]|uniref:Uncharacterized protein n=1 Tax=Mikania micrantha TaxID=192012 RepID=A0A5N6PSN6_9ASTR|nr:hypothetical protein E3N88_06815 [Mikania micrantha]
MTSLSSCVDEVVAEAPCGSDEKVRWWQQWCSRVSTTIHSTITIATARPIPGGYLPPPPLVAGGDGGVDSGGNPKVRKKKGMK